MLTTGFPFIDKDLAGFPENKFSFALCDNPSSRLFFAFNIVNHFVKEKKLIYYIDFDTIFTSYILNEHNSFSNSDDFVLFTPKRDQLSTIISNICSMQFEKPSLVIFDSLNLLYHSTYIRSNFGESNRIISLYLALLHQFAQDNDVNVLTFSLSRTTQKTDISKWQSFYPGGISIESFNSIIFHIEHQFPNFNVMILKHPSTSLMLKQYTLQIS